MAPQGLGTVGELFLGLERLWLAEHSAPTSPGRFRAVPETLLCRAEGWAWCGSACPVLFPLNSWF